MNRAFRFAGLLLAAGAVLAGSAVRASALDAPADRYFGPFKYSALAIRSKIGFLGRSYRERWADDASLLHDAALLETAFADWRVKFPRDVWLAPTALHLAELYAVIQDSAAQAKALRWFQDVARSWPSSKEAHLARARLAQGLAARHAETPLRPTPAPYGSPSASPSSSPSASPSPSGSPAASASPSALPTPKR